MADRLQRAVEGPPVPSSRRPKVVAGPIIRRALLLRDGTPATARPERPDRRDDRPADVRRHLRHLALARAGDPRPGRQPRGRSAGSTAADVLEWDTRLVVRPPGGRLDLADSPGGPARAVEVGPARRCPVLAWTGPGGRGGGLGAGPRPGRRSPAGDGSGWPTSRPRAWGVWISQVELPILLGLANRGERPALARLRAVLGRLADNRPWTAADLDAARPALPPVVFAREPDPERGGRAARRGQRPAGRRGRMVGPDVPVPAARRPP